MQKKAISGQALVDMLEKVPGLARVAAGGTAGGLIGQYVTPKLYGYDDDANAKHLSTTMNALTGALLMASPKALHSYGPKAHLGIGAGIMGEELVPQLVSNLSKGRETMEEQTRNTIPAAISRIAGGGVGRGALAGTAAAGLAGLGTGLTRARTEEELKSRKSRSRMIASDFMKYVLPLAIAGGVTGGVAENMNNKQASAKPRTARQDDIQRLLKHI